jgi:membrane fusion protein (multidrug efflux system)
MDAEVDVRNQDGKALAEVTRAASVAQTQVFNVLDKGADAEVQRVIAANTGHGTASNNVAHSQKGSSAPAVAGASVASNAH